MTQAETTIKTQARSIITSNGVYIHTGDFIEHLQSVQEKTTYYSRPITALQEWVVGIVNEKGESK